MSSRGTRVLDVLKNPYKVIKYLGYKGHFKWISDETYIKICYKASFGKWPDLENPKTFNEKLNWLKLHDRKPIYTSMVDKYEVKKYVADIIGEEYIIPTLGVWDKFEEIDFGKLPDRFVLKCTHDSGSVLICRDKRSFNKETAKKSIESSLKRNFYYVGREWPYINIKPRIIAEKYMEDESKYELKDYKFLCFNGEPKLIEVHSNRFVKGRHTQDIYDINWKKTDIAQIGSPISNIDHKRPITYEKMVMFSKLLSNTIPHVRVDWYDINGGLYFGEFTFYDSAGFCGFERYSDEKMLGEWIRLPK